MNVSFANGETPIAADLRVGENARGDLLWVTNGACSFTFDPKSAFAASGLKAIDNLKVTLTPAAASGDAAKMSEALYKIVNLDTGDITDITRADLVNGLYGSYETNYDAFNQGATVNLDDIFFWTGVTNGTLYKTQLMALRRIPAASYGEWTMGNSSDCTNSTAHTVSLTKDYWLGVFEVTQDQYRRITGSWGYSYTTNDTRYGDHRLIPAVTRWNDVRDQWGTSATAAANSWPAKTDHTVMDGLFLQKLRARTRNVMKFDLPTEAQWEFACRAGTDTALYLGTGDNNLKFVGWGQVTSGMGGNGCPTSVGRFYPNAFGLYDMLGNVHEVCLDFYVVNYAVTGANLRNLMRHKQTHLFTVSILHGNVISRKLLFIRIGFIRTITIGILGFEFYGHTLEHIVFHYFNSLHFMLFHAAGTKPLFRFQNLHCFAPPRCFL